MLRFRYTITDKTPNTLVLFNSSAMLLHWRTSPMKLLGARLLEVRPEDFVDAEWIGCEFVKEDGIYVCQNLIHAAYARVPENGAKHVVEKVLGWTCDDLMPVQEGSFMNFAVRRLDDNEGLTLPYPL